MAKTVLYRLLLLVLFVVAGCTSTPPRNGIRYDVDIDGAGWSLGRAIEESAAVCKFQDAPPSTVGQLKYRMQLDEPTIDALLESKGYYGGSAHLFLNETKEPPLVEIKVHRGKAYVFRQVDLRFAGESDDALKRIRPRLRSRQRVVADEVFAEEARILEELRHYGYPFPKLVRRTVEVDHESRKIDLRLEFDPGRAATFGPVRIEGLVSLKEKYIRRQVPWEKGDPYDSRALSTFERKLLASGLFSSMHVEAVEEPSAAVDMPVIIRATERDKRSVRLGVSYSDVGPGGKGQWVHRSLFGGGERLDLSVEWNEIELNGSGRFTRSGFLDAKQSLEVDLDVAQEKSDAYDSTSGGVQAMVLRDLTPKLQFGLGTGFKESQVEQLDEDERYSHVFFPVKGSFDSRNDRLNPVRGMQFFGQSSFFEDMQGAQSFLKTVLEARHYAMLWERYRLSSALRFSLGSIDGAAMEAVPADERFYSGGGGSVRGYEYQQIGPQQDGVPLGGDKMVEFSMELRMQPGRRLGYAAFVDGGTVYNDGLDRSLRYGAGVGLRWFTGVGPLRVDVAFPLNPSDDQVERLQFYISLGQAF